MTEPGSAAPPGWYRDYSGYPRWWDGAQWGPYAPPPAAPRDSSQALSVISHLGTVIFVVVVPLVTYLTVGKKNSFVRHHAGEALNFQLTFLIVGLVGFMLFFGSFFLSFASDGSFPGFYLAFPLISLIWFGAIGFSIMGAVRASQHQWWRYPVAIRFLRPDAEG